MAVVGPQNKGIPSHITGLGNAPKLGVGSNPWHIPAANGLDVTQATTTGVAAAPPGAAPAPAVAAPTPIAAPDFKSLALNDDEYTQGQALLARNNTMNLKALKDAWLGNSQSSQDSYNSHGALSSGAAVNAQRHLGQDYETAQAKQALDFDQGGSGLYFSVLHRLMNQFGQPLGAPQ